MSKHQTPWAIDCMGYILDSEGREVARLETMEPETRAVLLHAAEIWEALNELTSVEPGSAAHRSADAKCCELARKIEAEIAKGKP